MSDLLRIVFIVGDFLFLNLSIFLSFYFCGQDVHIWSEANKIYLIIFSNLAWMFLVMVASPYRINKGWTASKIAKSQIAFIFIHLVVVASLIVFFRRHYSLLQIALMYVVFVGIFFSWKIVAYYFRNLLTPEVPQKNYILIGKNEIASSIRKYYLINPELKFRFCGYFDPYFGSNEIAGIRKFCAEKEVHEILCCTTEINKDNLQRLVSFGLDSLIKIRIVTSPAAPSQTISFDPVEQRPTIDFEVLPLDTITNRILKRVFDIIFSSVFLICVMSWLLPIIGILIKIDSDGPVFFLQPRSGRGNKPFNCLKFRTMKVNREANTAQATKNDARITKLGAFLRKTSIDELPQFFNVFAGNMSVVGPRPHMLKHTEEYSKLIESFIGRHYIKPGITGLAQVMGYRGETRHLFEMKNRVTLDRFYIENWSFGLDIKIIYLTVISLIRGSEKAY